MKDKWIRELQSRLQEKENAVEVLIHFAMNVKQDRNKECRKSFYYLYDIRNTLTPYYCKFLTIREKLIFT